MRSSLFLFQLIQNINSTKIVITNFQEKLRKWSFMVFIEIKIMRDVCEKPRNKQILNYLGDIILSFRSRQRGG